MKRSKILMLAIAAFLLVGGSGVYVNTSLADTLACEIAGSCGKCGDGYCAKQCGETAKSCPRDCGTPSAR